MASSVTAAPPMALPRGAGRLVALDGAVADVLALHSRQRGQHGEHDPVRVVPALQLARQELQADTGGAQLLGERRELDAAAEPLVLVHHDVTAAPDARTSRARATAFSSSGRVTARAEIFSAKIRGTPEARSEPAWVPGDCRAVDARAYPIRTCPAGVVPAAGGRGSSVQADPGLRTGGTGTPRTFARRGTSRNRAVWYWAATRPLPVRPGDPAGAAHDDIGQSFASTRRKSSPLTRRSFHGCVSPARPFATTNETAFTRMAVAARPVSQAATCETRPPVAFSRCWGRVCRRGGQRSRRSAAR